MSRRMAVTVLVILAAGITAAIDPRYLLVPLIPALAFLPEIVALGVLGLAGWCVYRIVRPGKRTRGAHR